MLKLTKVTRDILGYIPLTFLPPIITLAGVVCFSRVLGPTLFGQYILVIVTTQTLASISQGWLAHSIFRYHNDRTSILGGEERGTYLVTLILLFALTLVAELSVLVFIFTYLDLSPMPLWLMVGFISMVSFGLLEAMSAVKRATMAVVSLNKLVLTTTAISVGLACGYVAVYPPNPLGLLAVLASSKLAVLVMFVPWRSLYRVIGRSSHSLWAVAKVFFTYGFPLSLATIGHRIMSIADRYFIEYYLGTTDVGLYSAGYEIFFKLSTMSLAFIGAATMPHLMKSFDSGKKTDVERIYKKAIYMLLLLLAPLTGFIIIYGLTILAFILGEAYSILSVAVIQLVSIGAFFWIMATYQYRLLMLVKKTKFIALSSLICALINLVGNYLLIPRYGVVGAAISTAISYVVLMLLTQELARQHFRFASVGGLNSILFLGAGFLGAWLSQLLGRYCGIESLLTGGFGTLFYLGISFILTFLLFQLIVSWNKDTRAFQILFFRNIVWKKG